MAATTSVAAKGVAGEVSPPASSIGRIRCRGWVLDALIVALIAAYIVALMPGLTRWPALINDEGREANLFWVLSGVDPAAARMNAHRGFPTWGNGGIQAWTAAAIFRVAGMGVFQARLTSLLWAGALLIVTYALGRFYWRRAAGLVAVVMLAVSDPFLVSSHTLRPDIQVATLVLLAVLLTELAVLRSQPRWALLAGLALGLAVDAHPNALAFMPLVGLVLVMRQGWRFWREPHVRLLAAGLALAALQYFLIRVVPDPAGYLAGFRYWVGVDKLPPSARGDSGGVLTALANELARYWDYFGEEPLELALVLVGLAAGLWWAIRGERTARILVLGLIAVFAFFVVAVSTKSKYYMLLTYPLYMLLVARVLERLAAAASRWTEDRGPGTGYGRPRFGLPSSVLGPRSVHAATLIALLALAAYFPLKVEDRAWENYIRARRYRAGQEYTQLTDRLQALAGPEARILAPPVYWVGLRDHPYVDIYVFERLNKQLGMTPAQFLEETRPDFVITDAKIATDRRIERLLYNELDARAQRQLIVRHKNYGDVAVYQLRWD